MKSRDFLVRRDDLRRTEVREADLPAPAAGQALLRVDRFGFSANNITYGAFGDEMSYWRFFPAPDGFGRIPVWGFADVLESRADGLQRGERLFGYLPMSTHWLATVGKQNAAMVMEASPHRSQLPAAYNRYMRSSPAEPADEDDRALLWPLYITSFLIDDFLADNRDFGAAQAIIASASSKTAIGLAFLLHRRGVRTVGLTSAGNASFVRSLGCYAETATYDAVAGLPRTSSVLVDMAGDTKVRATVHERFADLLVYSCVVGATHWESRQKLGPLAGPKPVFFFAPERIAKRGQDWGPGGLDKRLGEAWGAFRPMVRRWLKVEHARGPEAVGRIYDETVAGRLKPDRGPILSLHG